MFTGITLATIITDAQTVGAEFAFAVGVFLAFWGVRKLIRAFRSVLGG